jgi:hypothetical protein
MRVLLLLLSFVLLVSADFICRCQNTDNNLCTTSADCALITDECLCTVVAVDAVSSEVASPVVAPPQEQLSVMPSYTMWESIGIVAGLFAAVIVVLLVGVYLEYFSLSVPTQS